MLINYGAVLSGVLFLQCVLISAEEHWMASSHQPSTSSCRNQFHAPRQNVMLNISQNDNLQHRSVIRNVEACKALCLRRSACRSITFYEVANFKRCYLNKVNNRDDGARIERFRRRGKATFIERECFTAGLPMASTSCTQQFDAEQPNVLLNIRGSLSLLKWNVPSIEDCKKLCLLRETCRSVTFQETASKCYLNNVNHRDDGVRILNHQSNVTLVERLCSEPQCGVQSPRYPPRRVSSRIVGGEEAIPHSWPWMVALLDDNYTFCGGSIINRGWISTAAHCVNKEPVSNSTVQVLAGAHHKRKPESSHQIRDVAYIHVHPSYESEEKNHDLALLELATELEYSDEILPVCLPRVEGLTDQECITTGWGATKRTGDKSVLNQVHVPLISHSTCSSREFYGNQVRGDTMICAGYRIGTRDACRGDSGGPLVCTDDSARNANRYYEYGIVSWGRGCARENKPGVYTNVANYIDWIQKTTDGAVQIP